MFVLGIDPGLRRCGYCCVEAGPSGPRARALGVITTPHGQSLAGRLAELQRELRDLMGEWRPAAVAVEQLFFQQNVRTAISVGQASGIVLAEAAAAGAEVVEYTPSQVKQAVAGDGAASKHQVQEMVRRLLSLPEVPEPPDAADAAAVALCHLALAPLRARVASALVHQGAERAEAAAEREEIVG